MFDLIDRQALCEIRNLRTFWQSLEQSAKKGPEIYVGSWWIQAPMDEMAQLKIGLAIL
jgi:hypothetical protein